VLGATDICRPITAPFWRALMIESRDAADNADETDAADPIDIIDAAEPTDPIDNTEPIEPTDSNDPRQPPHNTESSDHSDHLEFAPTRPSNTASFDPSKSSDQRAESGNPNPSVPEHASPNLAPGCHRSPAP
jgi:hypothetical protein